LSGNESHSFSSVARTGSEHGEVALRTYRGRTVEELIPKIQSELGSDAIILGRREGLTGGLAGFFQRPFVEIEAMAGAPQLDLYDEPSSAMPSPPSMGAPAGGDPVAAPEHPLAPPRPPVSAHTPFYEREPPRWRPEGSYVSEHLAALARARPPQPPRPAGTPASDAAGFREPAPTELIRPFAAELERATSAPPPAAARPHASARPSASARRAAPPSRGRAQANIERQLHELGIGEELTAELIATATTHILPLAPRAGLIQAVRSALVQRIPVAPPLPTRGAAIALVGPGGAGKTSCCAALLGAYRRSSILPASCATLLEGAKRGELQMLLSPHLMRPTPIERARAVRTLRKTRERGLLAIDTPPMSVGDRAAIRNLAGLLRELQPERVVVVLPATLGAAATAQLLEALRPLGANALAVTHVDETDQIGVAVEAACRFALAPEYVLNRPRTGGWGLSRIDPTGLAAKLLR
jgi:flagellar biosynthesis GTPase FlhF